MFYLDDIIEDGSSSTCSTTNHNTNTTITGGNNKKTNMMLIDLLEKFFNENPWYDMTNLEDLIIKTSLDELFIKVIIYLNEKKNFFFL